MSSAAKTTASEADPILLSLFANRFMSIAEVSLPPSGVMCEVGGGREGVVRSLLRGRMSEIGLRCAVVFSRDSGDES